MSEAPTRRTHAELLAALESRSLDEGEFCHRDHIRVAWYLLASEPYEVAVERLASALQRLAAGFGVPEKYHETITMFYLHRVRERMQQLPDGHTWQRFVASNTALFEPHELLLQRYYSKPVLMSAAAREHFVLPDKTLLALDGAVSR